MLIVDLKTISKILQIDKTLSNLMRWRHKSVTVKKTVPISTLHEKITEYGAYDLIFGQDFL